MDMNDNDALIDAWHDGYFSYREHKVCQHTDANLAKAWNEGREQAAHDRHIRPVMVERPEGYYHAPVGTFD